MSVNHCIKVDDFSNIEIKKVINPSKTTPWL
jgi:hypothetical protein